MSGFFGMLRTDGAGVEPSFLEQVAEQLRFRGPDGVQIWTKDGLGVCFTYLETGTPHQTRCQPVRQGERYTLIGEVRLDARNDLIGELREKRQHASEDSSDPELLLLAWSVLDEAVLAKLPGDFSFGLWDASLRTLVCARDFAGARPFFYTWRDGVFCFSNTLNVLRRTPGISNALDDAYVRDFLISGFCSDPSRTVWRDVRRLPAGYRLALSGGQVQVQRFQSLSIEEPLRFKDEREYVENYRELLSKAVGDRLPAKKAALYLSGGLDSASVCSTAARISGENGNDPELKAFTISWRPLLADPEPGFARLTARHLGLAHEILEENSVRPDEHGAEAPPEPTVELFLGRERRFYQTISQHARIVLSGDGGDDVLTGQSWPYLKYLSARGQWGEIIKSFGGFVFPHGRFPPLRGGFRKRIRRLFGIQDASQPLPAWLNEEFASRSRPKSEERSGEHSPIGQHPLHPAAYRALHGGYWARVHECEDAGCTGVNLEARAPLLDLRLLRFLLRLPPVPWTIDKELTRRAMKGGLPDKVLARPKAPLIEDPLEACQRKAGWRPISEKCPPKLVHEFVNWESWLATLENPKGYLTYDYLTPLSFSWWLKAIEKEGGIQ